MRFVSSSSKIKASIIYHEDTGKCTLEKGSQAVESILHPVYTNYREARWRISKVLIEENGQFITNSDVDDLSVSAAASIITDSSINGNVFWLSDQNNEPLCNMVGGNVSTCQKIDEDIPIQEDDEDKFDDIETFDLNWFAANRPEHFAVACEIITRISKNERIIGLFGALKSGKRIIAEIIALMLPNTQCYNAISLNSIDMLPQFDEQKLYGIETVRLGSSKVESAIPNYDSGKKYLVIRDEDDYGDGEEQKYAKFFDEYAKQPNVSFIPTSATPMSLMAAFEIYGDDLTFVALKPPSSYMGVRCMKKGYVVGEPFIKKQGRVVSLSDDLKRVISQWMNQTEKTVLIVRDTSFLTDKDWKRVQKLIREYQISLGIKPQINVRVVDKDNSFEWMNDSWDNRELIIVKRTFTRGTETNCHPKVYGWYDARGNQTQFNTLLESIGRLCGFAPDRLNDHILLFLSEDGFRYVEAYNYMEEAFIQGVPVKEIVEILITKYSINKPSKSVKWAADQNSYDVSIHDSLDQASDRAIKIGLPEGSYVGSGNYNISGNNAQDLADHILRKKAPSAKSLVVHIDKSHSKYIDSWNKLPAAYQGKYALFEKQNDTTINNTGNSMHQNEEFRSVIEEQMNIGAK